MAELLIRTPGQPDRRVPLPSRTFVVGRHESCDVQILEVKASKRHFEVAPAPVSVESAEGAVYVVTDLQSSNGTFVGEARVMRRLLGPGEEIRVGDTRMSVVGVGANEVTTAPGGGAPAGIRISKGLVVDGAPTAGAVTPANAFERVRERSDRLADPDDSGLEGAAPTPDERRAAAAGRRAVAQGAIVFALGVIAVLAVELFVSKTADRRGRDRAEADAYATLLANRDEPFAKLSARYDDFQRDFPLSARTPELQKLIDARRGMDARFTKDEAEFNRYVSRLVPYTDSEVYGRLTDLLEAHSGDGDALKPRIEKALADLSAANAAAFARDRATAKSDVERLLAAGDAGTALRRLRALMSAYPALATAERSALADELGAVATAATALADAALSKAESTADPDVRRHVLLEAIRGLSGTAEMDRVASVLRRVTGGSLPTAGGTTASTGRTGKPKGGESIGLLSADVLGRIADAEALSRGRRWFEAATAYDRLLKLDASERVKANWSERRNDIGRVIALVDDLKKARVEAKDGVLPVRIGGATWDVLAIDEQGVRARRSGIDSTVAWPDVVPRDLVALLAHGPATPDRHLALATLAADLGDRPAAVEHLIPLMDLPTHKDLAASVMAQRMEGRTSVPEGGYRVLDGDLLDVAEWTRRTDGRRLSDLKSEAAELVQKASEDPALEKLRALRARREELDRRRAVALLAIFNEKHWPYPHTAPSMQVSYGVVTGECEKRWKAVEEVWDEPARGVPGNTAALEKLVARHAEVVKELAAKEVDTDAIVAAMEPYAIYAGAPTMTIRTFYKSREEKELLAYNRWVMDVYNPEHTFGLSPTEIEQIRITNEYRVTMGFMFVVEPGPAAVEAIDSSNVSTILDQARETARRPLKAVRINEHLWKAARGHSDDMAKRGFFSHDAPANPSIGEPGTSPPDRMHKAGYPGNCGENIATASNPMGAHLMWLHSSGHHRNILTNWEDMGMGFDGGGGGRATQNFGAGGGMTEAVIPEGAPTSPSGKRKKKDSK